MSINMDDDNKVRDEKETYCESVASQEELYLEETEEEVFAVLISDEHQYQGRDECGCENRVDREIEREVETLATGTDNTPHKARDLDEQLSTAAEELITGDSDDPPLSDKTVMEMLKESLDVDHEPE